MAANTRMATAIQILCVIAYKGPSGTTSEVVSRSLRTNPVVVRRLLKCMQRQGLVEIRPGKDGGVQLGRAPDRITLEQIHQAVEAEAGVFALRPRGNPGCPVDSRMKDLLTPIFQAADRAVAQTLGQTTLASLVQNIVA
jgi:Rrf2 family protein